LETFRGEQRLRASADSSALHVAVAHRSDAEHVANENVPQAVGSLRRDIDRACGYVGNCPREPADAEITLPGQRRIINGWTEPSEVMSCCIALKVCRRK